MIDLLGRCGKLYHGLKITPSIKIYFKLHLKPKSAIIPLLYTVGQVDALTVYMHYILHIPKKSKNFNVILIYI